MAFEGWLKRDAFALSQYIWQALETPEDLLCLLLCGEGDHVCTYVGAHRGQKALDPLELVTGDCETHSTSAWDSAGALAEPSLQPS